MNCFQAVLSAGRRAKTAFCLLAGRLCSDVKYSDDEMDEDEKDGREEVRVCVSVWRDEDYPITFRKKKNNRDCVQSCNLSHINLRI